MMFTLEDFKTSDGLIVMTEDAARILLYSERKNKSLGVVHRDEIMAELKMKKTREFSDLISDKKNCLLEKSIYHSDTQNRVGKRKNKDTQI